MKMSFGLQSEIMGFKFTLQKAIKLKQNLVKLKIELILGDLAMKKDNYLIYYFGQFEYTFIYFKKTLQ